MQAAIQEILPYDSNMTLKCTCEKWILESPETNRIKSKRYVSCDLCCEKLFNMKKSSESVNVEMVFE